MKAYAYIRKSTDESDRQVLSLDSQREICKNLKSRYGLEIVEWFEESVSAERAGKRKKFTEMLERIQSKNIPAIVCWKPNRLARNSTEGGILIDAVKDGLKIYGESQVYERKDTFLLAVEFGMSSKFSQDLSDDVKVGLNRKVEMGWRPGKSPIGYINNRDMDKGRKSISTDPRTFDLVKGFFDLVASGNYSTVQALREQRSKGLLMKTKYGEKPMSRKQADLILRNPFYYGYFSWNGEIFRGEHQPMITKDQFDKIQRILDGRHHSHSPKHDFYFMRLLKCKQCNHYITADVKYKKLVNGEYNQHVYAKCKCPATHFDKEQLENIQRQMVEIISNLRTTPEFVQWYLDTLKEVNESEFNRIRATKSAQARRQDSILAELKNLMALKTDGAIDQEVYIKDKNRLMGELADIKQQLSNTSEVDQWVSDIEKLLKFSTSCQELFTNGNADIRRKVMNILSRSNLVYDQGKVLIEAKKAFVFLKEAENAVSYNNAPGEPSNEPIQPAKHDIQDSKLTLRAGNYHPVELYNYLRLNLVETQQLFQQLQAF